MGWVAVYLKGDGDAQVLLRCGCMVWLDEERAIQQIDRGTHCPKAIHGTRQEPGAAFSRCG